MDTTFFDGDSETLDRASLKSRQEAALRRLMASLGSNRFYRAKLADAGTTSGAVRTLEDLSRLPYTSKQELVESQRRHPPFGELLSYPLRRYRHYHRTSGTSGQPLHWLDTEEDWETWVRCWARVYRAAGVTEDDLVFCAFSFGPYIAHWTAMAGAERVGAMRFAGGGMSTLQRLETIVDSRATVVLATPTYALHLAEVASRHGIDLAGSAVRVTIHAGEPGASVPNVKRRIEEAWGARCFDHAGATEVGAWAFDCQAPNGSIHLNELEFIFELIDPSDVRPVGDGRPGELVITTLGRLGMPVIRYRTGDLARRLSAPCACGRTLARIDGGVLGRVDDMFIVRGVNLHPAAMDDVIRGVSGIVEYEVEIRGTQVVDDVVIRFESEEGFSPADVADSLVGACRARFNIRVGAEPTAAGSLPRYELKAQRYKRRCE